VPHRIPIDLDALLRGLYRLLRRAAGPDVDLELRLDAKDAEVALEPIAALEAMVDLALDARGALPVGGTLLIETFGPIEARGIGVRLQVTLCARPGRELPAGPGLPLVDGTLGPAVPGALLRRLAEGEGGAARISSLPDCVVVSLSLPGQRRAPIAAPPASTPGPRRVVLVVDDEPLVQRVLSRVLTQGGYEPVTVSSAEEAMSVLTRRSSEISLVVTDVGLPGASGADLGRRVAAAAGTVPVLYMSGTEDDTLLLGLEPLLRKPFTPRALLELVREALGDDAGNGDSSPEGAGGPGQRGTHTG
jgi:two-component system, cell cycle sensor histidine kinase and response regulator CckA